MPAQRLDHFGEKYEKVALVKIDVEGYEKFVVSGGAATLRRTECVYFEVSDKNFQSYGYRISALFEQLTDMGFLLFVQTGPTILKSINDTDGMPLGENNVFAIRHVEDFVKRTGWEVLDNREKS